MLPAARPKLPSDFEEATWAKLRNAVQAVHAKRAVSCSLEELYRVRDRSIARSRTLATATQ